MQRSPYRLSPVTVARKLFIDGKLIFALGRFPTVRRGYTAVRRTVQKLAPPRLPLDPQPVVDIPGYDLGAIIDTLHRDSIFAGMQISPQMVAGLQSYARTNPLTRWDLAENFMYEDVRNGRLADGRPVVVASVHKPTACPTIAAMMRDPRLYAIASAHLGYAPTAIRPVLFWTFASDLPASERRKVHHANTFHYDVDGFNFLYIQFFGTDIDETTGPHLLMRGTHAMIPMSMLFSSVRQTDEAIMARFGPERAFRLTGKSGLGFVEDTTCFHKALPPHAADRLLLQLVYS
jgi:hypothetical protein